MNEKQGKVERRTRRSHIRSNAQENKYEPGERSEKFQVHARDRNKKELIGILGTMEAKMSAIYSRKNTLKETKEGPSSSDEDFYSSSAGEDESDDQEQSNNVHSKGKSVEGEAPTPNVCSGNDDCETNHGREISSEEEEEQFLNTNGKRSMISQFADVEDERYSSVKEFSNELELCRKLMEKLLTWGRMMACITVAGPVHFSKRQYEVLSACATHMSDDHSMPSYKTVRYSMLPAMLENCFPKSKLVAIESEKGTLECDQRAYSHSRDSVSLASCENGAKVNPTLCVRIVLPSSWARYHVSMSSFFSEVYENEKEEDMDFLSVEKTDMVQNRALAVGRSLSVSGLQQSSIVRCKGDAVLFPLANRPNQGLYSTIFENEGWDITAEDEESGFQVKCRVGPLWFVHRNEHAEASSQKCPSSLSTTEKKLWELSKTEKPPILSTGSRAHQEERRGNRRNTRRGRAYRRENSRVFSPQPDSEFPLCVGDVCVLLRPYQQNSSHDVTAVLVTSFLQHVKGRAAETIYWIDTNSHLGSASSLKAIGHSVVTNLPTILESSVLPPVDTSERMYNRGYMENGERYVVYRVALYTDGFKQHKSISDSRSVGGCYLLPLGLNSESRRSTEAPRMITVSPHGANINEVMSLLIDDIVRAATEGVVGKDPYGKEVRIFIDPLTVFADYPAATMLGSSMGHSANTFCTHCIHRRLGGRSRTPGPEVIHTHVVHSARLGFRRFDERITMIRERLRGGTNFQDEMKILGLKTINHSLLFNVRLSRSLEAEAQNVPNDNTGRKILDPRFDSSLSPAVMPDHMFYGVCTGVLDLAFLSLPADSDRRRAQEKILNDAHENDLSLQGQFIKWKNGRYDGLHSLTMSATYTLLLFSSLYLSRLSPSLKEPARARVELPYKLHKLVLWSYFWPNKDTDGDGDITDICGEDKIRYEGELLRRMDLFMTSAAAIADAGGPDTKRYLDVPNAHRIVEFCVHSVPMFGHARNFSELSLEMYHQVSKQWLERNRSSTSHITAVDRALTKDWLGRVYSNITVSRYGNGKEKELAEGSLRNLFLGNATHSVDYDSPAGLDFKKEFMAAVENTFSGVVFKLLGECVPVSSSHRRGHLWDALGTARNYDYAHRSLVKDLLSRLQTLPNHSNTSITVHHRDMARYVSIDKYDGRRTSYAHNRVRCGHIVSVKVSHASQEGVFVNSSKDCGTVKFFLIVHILESSLGCVWTIVDNLKEVSSSSSILKSYRRANELQLLQMDSVVRRAAAIHNCDEECGRIESNYRHSASTLEGGIYSIIDRRNGYPPHLG